MKKQDDHQASARPLSDFFLVLKDEFGEVDPDNVLVRFVTCDATWRQIEVIRRYLRALLRHWNFTGAKWNDELLHALEELVLNAVQHIKAGNEVTDDRLHVTFLVLRDECQRHFLIIVGGSNEPIDSGKLKTELPEPTSEKGRGTKLIITYSNQFFVCKDRDLEVLVKHAPLPNDSS